MYTFIIILIIKLISIRLTMIIKYKQADIHLVAQQQAAAAPERDPHGLHLVFTMCRYTSISISIYIYIYISIYLSISLSLYIYIYIYVCYHH